MMVKLLPMAMMLMMTLKRGHTSLINANPQYNEFEAGFSQQNVRTNTSAIHFSVTVRQSNDSQQGLHGPQQLFQPYKSCLLHLIR